MISSLSRPSRKVVAIAATLATAVIGVVTYSAAGASAEGAKSCWITAEADLVDETAGPGALTPQLALLKRQTDLSRVLDVSLTATGSLKAGVNAGPGGLPYLLAQVNELKTAKLVSNTEKLATFKALNSAGELTSEFYATQSAVDRTWRVTAWNVRLPAGTDCSADQLGDG